MGTFVANGQGTTQMLYRRNRYFDPTSGQFTQADPIGIAGGINAFGFAQGDPVNYSDPFGLCPPIEDCLQRAANWGASRVGAKGVLVLNAAAILNSVNDFDPIAAGFDAGYNIGSGHLGSGVLGAALTLAPETKVVGRLLGFASGKWLLHFEKHGAEAGANTAVEYLRLANDLMRGGPGVQTFVRSSGDKLFYREATNEFGVLASDGKTIRTYFKPEDGRNYWLDQITR
jgi:RHS repeat-associated protein